MNVSDFVVRVYGIYINEEEQLLVSDEFIYGKNITKFPGGGLESGEGTIDCLRREMMEETGCEFDILQHFYTTDFFVESAFDKRKQVISIYYRMKPAGEFKLDFAKSPFEFKEKVDGAQRFRFVRLSDVSEDSFTLIIDRRVGEMLKNENNFQVEE